MAQKKSKETKTTPPNILEFAIGMNEGVKRIELEYTPTTDDPKAAAPDLTFEEMEAPNVEKVADTLAKALSLDPRNVDALLLVASSKWQVAAGKWQLTSGKRQVARGKWQVASGK